MHVLITGGSGFLGGHIVDSAINKGYRVRAIVRPSSNCNHLQSLGNNVEIFTGNMYEMEFLTTATKNIDAIIHCLAHVSDAGSWNLFYETNVMITSKLITAAKNNHVKRFIFISSPSVVSELKDQVNIDENYPYPRKFLNYYCETKAIAEQLVLKQNSEHFLTCALRPRGIWGPRDYAGFMPKILNKIKNGKLKNFSKKQNIYSSICYVKNAAIACTSALSASKIGGKVYFITDEQPVNIWKFANRLTEEFSTPAIRGNFPKWLITFALLIIEILWRVPYFRNNFSPPISRYSVGMLTYTATYNISRAKRDLAYEPALNLDEGLYQYKQWIESIGGLDNYLNNLSFGKLK